MRLPTQLLNPLRQFLRLARADSKGSARLAPRRIYILPTGYGVTFAIMLLLMLVGAINYANNLGFLLTFLLAALGLVAMLQTWRNLVGLELRAGQADAVFAGQPALFDIHLINRRRWPRPGLQLQQGRHSAVTADLAESGELCLQLPVDSTQRGWLPIGRFTVSTRYPLGLLRAWAYVELDARCLVYPAPGESMPTTEQAEYSRSQKGDKGVGVDDFIGLRGYRAGDSPRQLYWKGVAREQELQTKMFGGDRSERRWLDWSAVQGSTEQRLTQLTRGVLQAGEQQIEYGLRIPRCEIPPGRGQAHRHTCLQALALFEKAS